MHKLHIIIKPDGTLLVVGILNPGMPWHYAGSTLTALKSQFGATATCVVIPYSSSVEVHDATLWGAIKRWWRSRNVSQSEEAMK